MSTSFTLAEIAAWVDGRVRGPADTPIAGVAGIEEAEPHEITWLADAGYFAKLGDSRAGAVVAPADCGPTPMPAVLCRRPSVAIITIFERFAPPVPAPTPGVHPTASVAESARLGKEVAVGPHAIVGEQAVIGDRTILDANVFVGAGTTIGADCRLWPGVVVRERCRLADRVVVHPNTTIGADGFGYEFVDGRHVKIPQIGTVEIEADVEIGAGCAVDRAKFGVTRIGAGTKIDNLVQVAHNVRIGPGCLIVSQCGIAGSTRLGRGVVLGGKVGIADHVVLGDGVRVGACSCVSKDIPAGTQIFGIPGVERAQWARERAKLRRLPQMTEQLKDLSRRVDRLESAADD